MSEAVFDVITRPQRLWSRVEILSAPCPIPAAPGVYGWYFRQIPCDTDVSACVAHSEHRLLYVGISPKAPPANGRPPSSQTIRSRIRYHYRGNAYGSTLRLTLGVLLGLQMRVVGSGRLTFGEDEAKLSEWMAENAFVTWIATPEPWVAEHELIQRLDLPLNLDANRDHAFWPELSRLRREARARARLGEA